MAVPKKRRTKARTNNRRQHIFIKKPALGVCSNCGQPVVSHTACSNCGFYRGRMVIDVLAKLTKRERQAKEKEIKSEGGDLSPEKLSKK
jgi:large subunit ribosomal protein L32